MSHNPTYDPEPGYSPYYNSQDDQPGTPPKYYTSSEPPKSNMASYRQATSGPPQPSSDSAGNGKSYRYATEAIPEDEDETDAPDTRQVQFTNGGQPTKQISNDYSEGCWSSHKFKIMALLAVVFAILWVIFMALYISEVTRTSEPVASGANTGESKETVTATAITTQLTTTAATIPTTTAPVTEDTVGSGDYQGAPVKRFILSQNGLRVELLSLGARINGLTKNGVDLVAGFNADTQNLTDISQSVFGSANGRICGSLTSPISFGGATFNPQPASGESMFREGGAKGFYMMNFNGERTSDGVRFTKTVTNADDDLPGSVDVTIMYVLKDNQLKVTMSAKPNGNADSLIDMCSSVRFNLDNGNDVSSHSLMVNTAQLTSGVPVGGLNDFSSSKSLSTIISNKATNDPFGPSIEYDYQLRGATGLRLAAELSAGNNKVVIHTNQEVARMHIAMTGDAVEGRRPYAPKSLITLITHSFPQAANNNQNKILLKAGATYESVVIYTVS